MSKYIDIVKIMRDNKELNLILDIDIEYKKQYSWQHIVTKHICKMVDDELFLDNGNSIWTFELNEKEGREKTARRFHNELFEHNRFIHINPRKVKNVVIKVTINDYSFFLNKRGWRV